MPTLLKQSPSLLIAGYALLILAWLFGNPPFYAPDEPAHYRRALGVASGELVGARATHPVPLQNPRQRRFATASSRWVLVPARLSPRHYICSRRKEPGFALTCTFDLGRGRLDGRETSSVATYEPLPSLLPALVMEQAREPASALRLGRLASALPVLLLLALAILLLWSGAGSSLVGVVIALPPMVLFVGSSLNGSGLEIAASVALVAAIIRLSRKRCLSTAGWLVLGGSAGALALSRSLGPLWVLINALVLLVLLGSRQVATAVRRKKAAVGVALGVVAACLALNFAWEQAYAPNLPFGFGPASSDLGLLARMLRGLVTQAVGSFGWLDVSLPIVVALLWQGLTLLLVAVAFACGAPRERILLVGTCACALGFPLLFYVAVYWHSGWGLQGRQFLPLLVLVPLVAAAIADRHVERLGRHYRYSALLLATGVAAPIQFFGWYLNAHHAAVGRDGRWWFLGDAEWSPPAGWWPWVAMAMIGATLLLAAGVAARTERNERNKGRPHALAT